MINQDQEDRLYYNESEIRILMPDQIPVKCGFALSLKSAFQYRDCSCRFYPEMEIPWNRNQKRTNHTDYTGPENLQE